MKLWRQDIPSSGKAQEAQETLKKHKRQEAQETLKKHKRQEAQDSQEAQEAQEARQGQMDPRPTSRFDTSPALRLSMACPAGQMRPRCEGTLEDAFPAPDTIQLLASWTSAASMSQT